MSKSKKMILKVLNLQASFVKSLIRLDYVLLYNDNSTQKDNYTFDKIDTAKIKNARAFKEFTSVVNKFLLVKHLDAQARKQMLTKNTHYDKSHSAVAKLVDKLDFVASNDRRKESVKKVIVKVAKAKKAIAKKTIAKSRA